jgi:hypothetical protein
MIESIVYQSMARLLHQYDFTITWAKGDDVQLLHSIVTVSFENGITTLVDISIEGELPEGFAEAWDAEAATNDIIAGLGVELRKFAPEKETF